MMPLRLRRRRRKRLWNRSGRRTEAAAAAVAMVATAASSSSEHCFPTEDAMRMIFHEGIPAEMLKMDRKNVSSASVNLSKHGDGSSKR